MYCLSFLIRSLLAVGTFSVAMTAHADIPDNEPNLEDTLMSANNLYQLRYSDNQYSVHYMPQSQVQAAANALDRNGNSSTGNPLGHHDGFADLGFRAPFFKGGVRDVTFWDCKDPADPDDFDCDNGFAILEQVIMPSPTYRSRSESCIRMIIGHELFHHVEFAYTNAGGGDGCGGTFGTTACEGQARAMQDKVYSDLDLNPGASCIASFRGEVNGYLGSPDRDIWSSSYGSALFWTYLMEQYGTFNEEPYRGADFITAWWELAEERVNNPDVYGITEETIQLFDENATLVNTYHDFTIANLMKDFSLLGIPASAQARYSYIDEKPHLNQNNLMEFDPVKITATSTVGANQTGTLNFVAKKFGGDYLRFNIGSCPAGSTMEFEMKPDPGADDPTPNAKALISLVLVKAPNAPQLLYKWRAGTAKASAVQSVGTPYQQAYFIVAGRTGEYAGRATTKCKPGPLAPQVKFAGTKVQPGAGGSGLGAIHVRVPDGDASGQSIRNLSASDLRVRVGGLDAAIDAVVPDGDGYQVRFVPPTMSGPGPFAVTVDTGTQSTTLTNAIRYDDPAPEVLFVVDLSVSMGTEGMLLPAIQKVRDAAARMKSQAKFGLVTFAGNGTEPNLDATLALPLAPLTPTHRANLESVLSSLTPSSSSIGAPGDGVQAAINAFVATGGTGPKSIVLITDGDVGEGHDAAHLLPQLEAQRIAVHGIAVGRYVNGLFVQRLGRDAGSYHFIPKSAAGPDLAALDLAMDSTHAAATREHVLLARQVQVPAGAPVDTVLRIDPNVVDPVGGAVFTVSTVPGQPNPPSDIKLFRPNGTEVIAGADAEVTTASNGKFFRLFGDSNGDFTVRVFPSAAGGQTQVNAGILVLNTRVAFAELALSSLRPDDDGTWRVGDRIRADVVPTRRGGVRVAMGDINVQVERPDGTTESIGNPRRAKRSEATLTEGAETLRFDFDLQNAGGADVVPDPPTTPVPRDSYRVIVETTLGDGAAPYVIRTTRSFAVLDEVVDTDRDGLPDGYEFDRSCLDTASNTAGSTQDPDGDGLDSAAERLHGTDPCDADTDEGGERDGSEVAQGRNPLDGDDDGIGGAPHVEIVSQLSQHETHDPLPGLAITLRYDRDPRTAEIDVLRGPTPEGPFLRHSKLQGLLNDGRYVDTGLVAGQQYCYQLEPNTLTGIIGERSQVVCAVARADMTAPTGMITLENGQLQTSKTLLTATIDFDNESAVGASMRLLLPEGGDSGWIPFNPVATIDTTGLTRPGPVLVQLQLRDAVGNESEWYIDDIDLVASTSVGGFTGTVQGNGSPLEHALIRIIGQDQAAPDMTTANGSFALEDLLPGTYTIEVSLPGYHTVQRAGTAMAGTQVNLGLITLELVETNLFRDSFE